IFDVDAEEVRINVLQMKSAIEKELKKQGRSWGEVKGGKGSIRDIEFMTQYLQLSQGMHHPEIRSINTSDGLIKLAEFDFIQADEYRQLANGYVFLRTIEHALQLTHYKQIHHLPNEPRELSYLARKLDFPDANTFLTYYEDHCKKIRKVYDKYLGEPFDTSLTGGVEPKPLMELIAEAQPNYALTFSEEEISEHALLLDSLEKHETVKVSASKQDDNHWRVTIVGRDAVGQFSVTCGLLFTYGYNIVRGHVFTGLFPTRNTGTERSGKKKRNERFVTVLEVSTPLDVVPDEVWARYSEDLDHLSSLLHTRPHREIQGILAKRVGKALRTSLPETNLLLPVEISLDNQTDAQATILDITGEDVPGFLYELTTGLAISGLQIDRVIIDSSQDKLADRLYVTDSNGNKITDEKKLNMLRIAIVLIKHFVHMLPGAPNPESALIHFRELVEKLFDQPDWSEKLASLEQPKVLDALAKLLGVSDFLWEDFLRLQYSNLFPVVTDIESLSHAKNAQQLKEELAAELEPGVSRSEKIHRINAFKDREMLRTDMRHILGKEETFGQFSLELTNIAEVVLNAATSMIQGELMEAYGSPVLENGQPCELCVAALGKCGGMELGFASDIELMFLYTGKGRTSGGNAISNNEFYTRLVEGIRSVITTKRDGIFELDLRLRPYGKAGSLAVSLEAFEKYFASEGAAWPYERQALVKFRPIAGCHEFGLCVAKLRDRLVYTPEGFDTSAMRGMREKQERQLVKPGTINAKLSKGGLVDCEYLVQGLQISLGATHPELRTTNTREALRQLEALGILSHEDRVLIRDAYRFLRRLIDALRMVRGDARELTVPKHDTEECEFLARRLGYLEGSQAFVEDLEQVMQTVREMGRLLDELPAD
ncbi:MAG: glutamine synthetase adenylyltransferase, partial [Planctomycetaceae bacterium]|nr:glutamine synthetase adenylyltransferase [Planctomycetaceae bacterium]